MNIIHIAKKEIIKDLRDVKTFIFLLAFPLVLMLVLGSALTNAFKTTNSIDNVKVLYKQTADSSLSQPFNQFIKAAKKSGIDFKKATDATDGKKEVKQNNYDGYVELNKNGVQLYLNDSNSIEGSILQGMFKSFVDKYNLASEVIKVAPAQIGTVFANQGDHYIQETSLLPHKQPSSMDYYAIVMTTMIALYGARTAIQSVQGERARKTGDRLVASPVRKSEIFIGKVLGNIIINTLCVSLVIAFSKLFFKSNWGDHLGLIFLIILTEVLLAVSVGIGISFLSKSNTAPATITMLFIQLSSFFGGAYFKIDNPGGILKFITDLSPLTWVNHAITDIIYEHHYTSAISAMSLNIGISILFLLISVISLQRWEGL